MRVCDGFIALAAVVLFHTVESGAASPPSLFLESIHDNDQDDHDFNDHSNDHSNANDYAITTTFVAYHTNDNNVSIPVINKLHGKKSIFSSSHQELLDSSVTFWYWCISFGLVIFAGCASGLTVGLLSLDPIQLQVLSSEGTAEQKAGVAAVMDVIGNHHLLLVTLLLANSIAMEALPIFLDRLVAPWAAVLLSVTAILLFGEIIPQALCTGPGQLLIAQRSAPFVRVLIAAFFFISWPIAKLLDFVLGASSEQHYYARAHLKALIRMHERERRPAASESSVLGADEVGVIEGALDLAGKSLAEIMVPIDKVFMLEASTPMTKDTLELILKTGHSRVPVYAGRRNNLRGIILTKTLITVNPAERIPAGDLIVHRRPIFARPDTNLWDLLNEFQKGHTHFAFVTASPEVFNRAFRERRPPREDIPEPAKIEGIATLEDVIEELIQEEIYDEFDVKRADQNTTTTGVRSILLDEPPNNNSNINKSHIMHHSTEIPSAGAASLGSLKQLPPIVQAVSDSRKAASYGMSGNSSSAAAAAYGTTSGLAVPLMSSKNEIIDHTVVKRTASRSRTTNKTSPPNSEGLIMLMKGGGPAATKAKVAMLQSRSRRAGSLDYCNKRISSSSNTAEELIMTQDGE